MDKKTTLVQILRSPEGGIRKHVVDIFENLSSEKFEKVFITDFSSCDRDLSYLVESHNVRFFDLKISDKPGLLDLVNIIKIRNFLKGRSNLLLHGHGAKGGLYARACSFLLGCPCLYTPHGGSLHRVFSRFKSFLYDNVERFLIPLTTKFVFESNYSANEFENHVGICGEKKVINHNGVAFTGFVHGYAYTPQTKLRLVSYGLLRELKGHDIVINSIKRLKDKGVDVSYTIYGYGEEEANLKSLIQDLGLVDSVAIKTPVDNILESMRSYDLVVQPSRFESFGYVPVEAMSIKVPVVTSYEGGLKELQINGVTLFSKNNTSEEYAEIFENIYLGKIDLKAIVDAAYVNAKSNFSIEAMVRNLEKIYSSLN